MANDGEINAANTQANVIQDAAGKSGRNKKRNATNKGQEVPPEVVSNEVLTSQEPSATEASEDEVEVLPEDVSLGKEWVMKMNAGMDAVEIFGQRLGKVEGTLSVLEGHTLEEIESIRNDSYTDRDGTKANYHCLRVQTHGGFEYYRCYEGKDRVTRGAC